MNNYSPQCECTVCVTFDDGTHCHTIKRGLVQAGHKLLQ